MAKYSGRSLRTFARHFYEETGTIPMTLRHLLAILLLPFVVAVIIPRWLLRAWSASDTRWVDGTLAAASAHFASIVVFLCGLPLFAWCVSLFASVGQGTLAPWTQPAGSWRSVPIGTCGIR